MNGGPPSRRVPGAVPPQLGTRMINNDVSLPAIQRMLDYDSPEMRT
jgi:hypothetical protein